MQKKESLHWETESARKTSVSHNTVTYTFIRIDSWYIILVVRVFTETRMSALYSCNDNNCSRRREKGYRDYVRTPIYVQF